MVNILTCYDQFVFLGCFFSWLMGWFIVEFSHNLIPLPVDYDVMDNSMSLKFVFQLITQFLIALFENRLASSAIKSQYAGGSWCWFFPSEENAVKLLLCLLQFSPVLWICYISFLSWWSAKAELLAQLLQLVVVTDPITAKIPYLWSTLNAKAYERTAVYRWTR